MITIGRNESSELETFKNRVRKVARKYASAYDWCSVVDEALIELGVHEPEEVSVNVETQIGTVTIRVAKNDLPSDPDEQRAFLASAIGPVRIANKNVSIGADFVIDANMADVQPANNVPYGSKDSWKFTSDAGRVRHYVSGSYSACGHYGWWVQHSSRDNGGFCKECSNHAR